MRIVRFVISGSIATAVNLTTLFTLTHFAHLWYVLSSVIAFCIALFVSFILQKIWTFEDASMERAHIQAALFFVVIMAGLGINTTFVYCLVEYTGVHYLVAQLISGFFIAIMNYISYKHLVFQVAKIDAEHSPIVGVPKTQQSLAGQTSRSGEIES
jgi:putative flippase GtrA